MEHRIKEYMWNILAYLLKLSETNPEREELIEEMKTDYLNVMRLIDEGCNAVNLLDHSDAIQKAIQELNQLKDAARMFDEPFEGLCSLPEQHQQLTELLSYFIDDDRYYYIGQTIELGAFPQEEDTPSAIRWHILDIKDNEALLISEYGLMASAYRDSSTYGKETDDDVVSWGKTLVRKKCQEFWEAAFSDVEKSILKPRSIQLTQTTGCYNDFVFLLSYDEASRYFPDRESRICKPTAYAVANGAELFHHYGMQSCRWWLMARGINMGSTSYVQYSSGYRSRYRFIADHVLPDGTLIAHSRALAHNNILIRPCICLDLKKYRQIKGEWK